ncbi:MAG: IclR family transcriptional regulator [Deltaproteobacteria bacterium]|jgi:DNA-binding IclR family transcriptional regulator|nr:IclR family transcriptional regulator [Deltaproteobacteria bacterium]
MGEKKYYQISSLEKGLKVLEAIVEHGRLTVTGVARLLGINRASSHRFITTLRDLGYVRRDAHGDYEATFKLLELGMTQADKFEIRRMAKPVMRDLAAEFDETVNLGILDNDQVVYLDKVESRELLRMDSGVGTTSPPYATALGKAMAAYLPAKDLSDLVDKFSFCALTPNTITSKEAFQVEMEAIRRKGYAVDNEELALHLYCIAAPIFDFNGYPSYAMSVSGPASRIKTLKDIPARLVEATRKLSGQLNSRGSVKI